jgi:hypothetical protein
VIEVEVRQEDLAQVDEPNRRLQELPLRALATVEEEALATSADK